MLPKRRKRVYTPRHSKKKPDRKPLTRQDWIAAGVSALFLIAMLPAFFLEGSNGAFLHYCIPVYSVLEQAQPTPPATPKPQSTPRPVQVEVEREEPAAAVVATDVDQPAPRILIYHTHATEAYLPVEGEIYEASGKWRTLDQEKSVVAVGEKLAKLLRETYGLGVLHDVHNYEPPKLSSAYGRSLTAMETYQKEYPTLEIFIDVHRDAYGTETVTEPKDYVELEGKQSARLMFVVGTGEGATGAGFGEKPDFESNLALAQAITDRLTARCEGLTREVRVKTGRYNQHVSSACLLVEVGHNANTLTQALNAVPYLAEAIAHCIPEATVSTALSAMALLPPE